jgi:glycosyltransferase involved in cell wall biosynthesis
MTSTHPKVALYYPAFTGGGAEAVGLWMMEALHRDYNITLFTITAMDFAQMDTMYGTHLEQAAVQVETLLPARLTTFANDLISNNAQARKLLFHWLIRYLKARQHQYDLSISAYNAVDLGDRGMNYMHWVNVLEGNWLAEKISGFQRSRIKESLAIANSYLVKDKVQQAYGCDTIVVYPPVVIDVQDVPWEEKEDAFICSGRLVKAKEPHRVIDILRQVREQGFDVKLYITGGGGGVYGRDYRQFLQKAVDANADWVTLCENLPYPDYVQLLSRCRYGIHYKKEPFGISIAEMVKAGAIPFVRDQGGQVEIVGKHNTDLLFADADEAIARITQVLGNDTRQMQLRQSLGDQKYLFSTERFMNEIRQVVADKVKREE